MEKRSHRFQDQGHNEQGEGAAQRGKGGEAGGVEQEQGVEQGEVIKEEMGRNCNDSGEGWPLVWWHVDPQKYHKWHPQDSYWSVTVMWRKVSTNTKM